MDKEKRVLFILKAQNVSECYEYTGSYSEACHYSENGKYDGTATMNRGLYFSAHYIVDMLKKHGVNAHLVQVIDGDYIDHEIVKFKPTQVILEALWVTPTKVRELIKLHPDLEFVVRIHSEIPFLAQETIAFQWIIEYIKLGVVVAFNSARSCDAFRSLYRTAPIVYLPDYFPVNLRDEKTQVEKTHLDISCFGSLRIMKNQLNQAVAAIQFGNDYGVPVHFHINNCFHGCFSGHTILENLRNLFKSCAPHKLIEHEWMCAQDFESLLAKMDVAMQVSFSESFNIVSAQAVNLDIPIVVSPEIVWASDNIKADPDSLPEIRTCLRIAQSQVHGYEARVENVEGLLIYSDESRALWLAYTK